MLLALYTLLTLANSWLYRETKGVNWFCLYSLFLLSGAIAIALRGQIPAPVSILGGTLLVVVGYACLYQSLHDFFGLEGSHSSFQVALLLLATIAMLEYGWIQPDTGKRLIAYSLILGLQQSHTVLLLLRNHEPALRIPSMSMAVMVGALVISNSVRILGILLHGAPDNYLNAGPFLVWILLVNTCLQWGAMVTYIWLTAARLRGRLEAQAITDPLTGALNRRGIEIAAGKRILLCKRDHQPLSAIVVDLDDFKRVNDTFGHHCGDATLITIAACLRNGIRPGDLLARIGGDEFAILLPNTPLSEAIEIIECLRHSVKHTEIVHGSFHTRVSASFGLAELEPDVEDWEQLSMRCDKHLYEEKLTRSAALSRQSAAWTSPSADTIGLTGRTALG
ncbi:GGDEF domain-containing protein [Edaphobacter sp. HDX4]|uniref:GGDEF domain-containing protein n=1 Tax=Edaphobacter sp. HDX4 TaxID=2794064 RepID=UPI002FE60741